MIGRCSLMLCDLNWRIDSRLPNDLVLCKYVSCARILSIYEHFVALTLSLTLASDPTYFYVTFFDNFAGVQAIQFDGSPLCTHKRQYNTSGLDRLIVRRKTQGSLYTVQFTVRPSASDVTPSRSFTSMSSNITRPRTAARCLRLVFNVSSSAALSVSFAFSLISIFPLRLSEMEDI